MSKKIQSLIVIGFAAILLCSGISRTELDTITNSKEVLDTKTSVCAGITESMSEKMIVANVSSKPFYMITQSMIIEVDKNVESTYEFNDAWITTNVNIRKEPNTESEILDVYTFNTKISCAVYNTEWCILKYGDDYAYVSSNYVASTECPYYTIDVPYYEGKKTWMPSDTITSTTSVQFKLDREYAYTGNFGCRMINGRYCIAVGSAVTLEKGRYVDLLLENGYIIPCIVAETKDDKNTDSNNLFTVGSNCCSEFVVDRDKINGMAKKMGDMSYTCDEWNSRVIAFKVYEKNVLD